LFDYLAFECLNEARTAERVQCDVATSTWTTGGDQVHPFSIISIKSRVNTRQETAQSAV